MEQIIHLANVVKEAAKSAYLRNTKGAEKLESSELGNTTKHGYSTDDSCRVTEGEAEEIIVEAQTPPPRRTASVTSSPVSTRARASQSPKLVKTPKIPKAPKSPKILKTFRTPKTPKILKTPRIPKSKSPKVLKTVRTPKIGRTPKIEKAPRVEPVEKLVKLPTRIKRKYVRRKGIEQPVEIIDNVVEEEKPVQSEILQLPKKVVQDPIEAGILDEPTANILYDEYDNSQQH